MNAFLNRVRELVAYDPATGRLTWKVSRGKAKAGSECGCLKESGYIEIGLDGRTYLAHRLAWLLYYGEEPSMDLDHENTNRSDNRISNLRIATRSQNQWNKGLTSANTSGFKGVYRHAESGKWVAQIRKHRVAKNLGAFDTPEAASDAYQKAAHEAFGEFANCSRRLSCP
jgi:hypothetical protein